MFISPFRRFTSVGTLAVLLLLIFGVWYLTNPQRIGRMSEVLLSNVLGGPVTVRSGHLSLSGTLLLSGVELGAGEGKATLPLFSADSIEARFDWLSLLSGQLRATQLTAVRPTLYLIEDRATDRWNYERLRTPRAAETQASGEAPAAAARPAALPVIILREARVEWAEVNAGHLNRTGAAIIEGQLAPDAVVPTMYRFHMNQLLDVPAGLPAGGAAGAMVTGTWEVATNRFAAVTSNIPLSEQLHRSMPRQVRNWWDEHRLSGSLAQFRLSFDAEDGLVLGADLNRVSMVQTLQSEPGGPVHTVNFRNVRGTLTFGITRPLVRVSDLRGEVLGFAFTAEGEFRGASAESPFELTLKFPNANLTSDYPPLFLAFPAAQDLVQRIRPEGHFDLELSLKRLSWNGAVFPQGKVVCRVARMRFVHFPYPLSQVTGEILFNHEQVDFRNVTAKAEEASVTMTGTIGTVYDNPSCDFTVSSNNCIFDDRMGACLPDKYRKVWDAFAIRATGGFVCKVQHARSRSDEHHVSVEVNVTDGRGYYRSVPLVFTHATGKIKFEGQDARLEGLQLVTGKDESGRVRIDGVVTYAGESLEDLRPVIDVTADVPIDSGLLGALPEPLGRLVAGMDLGGRVTFAGSAARHEDGTPKFIGALTLRDVHAATRDRQIDLSHISATARIDEMKLTLAALAVDIGPHVQAHAVGVVDLAAHQGELRLAAVARDQPIPGEAPKLVPQAVREMWTAYKPSGAIDGDLAATVRLNFAGLDGGTGTTGAAASPPASAAASTTTRPAEPVALEHYVVHVHPKGIALAPANWPDQLTDIQGIITLTPGEIDLDEMTATSGPMSLSGKGTYHRETGKVTASGALISAVLPERWFVWLPESVSGFLKSQKAAGAVTIDVANLQRESAGQPWQFKGTTTFGKVSTQGVWGFNAERLAVDAAGTLNRDGTVDLEGKLTGVNFAISGRTLDTLSATIVASAQQKTLTFSDVAGTVASGHLQGSFQMWLETPPLPPRYEAKLTLTDAPLAALLLAPNATEEDRKRIGTGKVTASLAVQESMGANPERTGRGELIVRDGTIYDVPLAMGLMQVASLRLPVAHAFNKASMSYYLRDNKVTFERILLESPGINLAGLGTLSLKDKVLDLTLLTESPNDLKLPFITEIIQRTRNELFQLSVSGTLENPKVIPVPLSTIGTTLKALLPPRTPKEER